MPLTQIEKLTLLVTSSGESTPNPELLEIYLDQASDIIQTHRYPHGNWPDELEPQYAGLQIRIAQALYNKQGAEGQTGHSENGISRTYGSDGVPLALLREIIPVAKIQT